MVAAVFIAKLDRDLKIILAATAVSGSGVGLWFAALLLLLASKPGMAGEQPSPTPNLSLAGFRELAEARDDSIRAVSARLPLAREREVVLVGKLPGSYLFKYESVPSGTVSLANENRLFRVLPGGCPKLEI